MPNTVSLLFCLCVFRVLSLIYPYLVFKNLMETVNCMMSSLTFWNSHQTSESCHTNEHWVCVCPLQSLGITSDNLPSRSFFSLSLSLNVHLFFSHGPLLFTPSRGFTALSPFLPSPPLSSPLLSDSLSHPSVLLGSVSKQKHTQRERERFPSTLSGNFDTILFPAGVEL